MKKGMLSCLVVLLSTATVSFAQLAIGAKAGINLATINDYIIFTDANGEEVDDRLFIGLSFGAVAEVGLTKNFYLQPEISYTQKGIGWDDNNLSNVNIRTTQRFDYLDVLALAKYKFTGEKIGGYVVAGPQLGYLIDGKTIYDGSFQDEPIDDVQDVDVSIDVFNRWEFSVAVGGGLVVPLSSQLEPFLDIRYTHGLTDFWDPGIVNDPNTTNRGVSITVGALFSLAKE
ncbi:MAG: porin family protein [Bacteroidota bacterium]